MASKRVYVTTAIMAFLSAPLVLLSQIGMIGPLLHFITLALVVIVLMVIAEKIMRPLGRSVLHLRVIAFLIVLLEFPFILSYIYYPDVPDTDGLLMSIAIFSYITIAALLFITYIILLLYLQKFSDPSLKLLNLHCTLRILGIALFMLGHIAVLFYVAAQIVLCIMLLRYAGLQDIPMGIIRDVVDEPHVDQHPQALMINEVVSSAG